MGVIDLVLAPEADWSQLVLQLAEAQRAGLTLMVRTRRRRPNGAPHAPARFRPPKMRVPKPHVPGPTEVKLHALLRETPNLCEVKTLTEIGRELGVSRERVRQLLPAPGVHRAVIRHQNLLAARSRQLAEYVKAHPLALLPPGRGGPSFREIAADLGWRPSTVREIWRLCEYPDRALLWRTKTMTKAEIQRYVYHNVPGRKERRVVSQARWVKEHNYNSSVAQKRVIGRAQCWECGKDFDMTQIRGWHMSKAGFVTCSSGCTKRWNREAALDEAVAERTWANGR